MADGFPLVCARPPLSGLYWQELAGEIWTIFGLKVDFSFRVLGEKNSQLELWNADNYLYKMLSAVSRKDITWKWL